MLFKRTQLFTHQLLGEHELGEQFEIDWGGSYNYLASTEPNRRQVTLVPEDQNEGMVGGAVRARGFGLEVQLGHEVWVGGAIRVRGFGIWEG